MVKTVKGLLLVHRRKVCPAKDICICLNILKQTISALQALQKLTAEAHCALSWDDLPNTH